MADAYTLAADALEQGIALEFSDLAPLVLHDKLHESRGWDGIEIGISPEAQAPMLRNAAVKETRILVQFYDLWDKEIDPRTQVDPRRITGFADRFERMIERIDKANPGSNDYWSMQLLSVAYPDDPTGNRTRFEARVLVRGDNTALTQR